jgi:hypothetical protein
MRQSPDFIVDETEFDAFLFHFWGGDGDRDDDDVDDDDDSSDSDDEDDSDESDDDDSDNDDDDDDDGSNAGRSTTKKPGSKDTQDDDDAEADADKLKAENIKLKRALDAEKDKNKVSTKGKTKLERDYNAMKTRASKLENFMQTTYIDAAIVKDVRYAWNNIEDVRLNIKDSAIRLDMETGEIEGLDLELKRIAKAKPYLLKKKATREDSDDDQGDGNGRQGNPGNRRQSGAHPFGGRTKTDGKDRARIASKYKIPGVPGITG